MVRAYQCRLYEIRNCHESLSIAVVGEEGETTEVEGVHV
jgi:hypothetical protein